MPSIKSVKTDGDQLLDMSYYTTAKINKWLQSDKSESEDAQMWNILRSEMYRLYG